MSDTPHLPPTKPLALSEAIAHTREAALFMQTAAEQLLDLARRQQTPPEVRPITLTVAQQVQTDKSRWEALSIGLLNTSPVVIYIGLAGASATLAGRGLPVPAGTLLIWPARAYDVEIGADPATPLTSNAVLFLMRFNAVQAAFLGSGF